MSVNIFPRMEFRTISREPTQIPPEEETPLHRPLFIIQSEKGPMNEVRWVPSYNEGTKLYGHGFLDKYSSFFSPISPFISKTFERQGCFIARVGSDNLKTASAIVEAYVEDADVVQYEKDAEGKRVVTNGHYVPAVDAMNETIKLPGKKVTFKVRQLDEDEDLEYVKDKTLKGSDDASEKRVYPLFGAVFSSPGAIGNTTGFTFFCDSDANDDKLIDNIKANLFGFKAFEKGYKTDLVNPVLTRTNTEGITCTFKPGMSDERIDQQISFEDMSRIEFADNLPFDIVQYTEYIEKFCEEIMLSENKIRQDPIANHWLVDFVNFKDVDALPYDSVEVVEDATDPVFFDDESVIFLRGGKDDTLDKKGYEELMSQYLDCKVFPAIMNVPKYRFTHMYDPGYNVDLKHKIIEFLNKREQFIFIASTQDLDMAPNSEAQDLASGSGLKAKLLLQPECAIEGTGCVRGVIVNNVEKSPSLYKKRLPATLEILRWNLDHYSTPSIKGDIGGDKDMGIKLLNGVHYNTYDSDIKNLMTENSINYIESSTYNESFFAGIKTVFPNRGSSLSDLTIANLLVFVKYAALDVWASNVGKDVNVSTVMGMIKNEMEDRIRAIIHSRYDIDLKVYRTDIDIRNGDACHVDFNLYKDPSFKLLNFNFICRRPDSKAK